MKDQNEFKAELFRRVEKKNAIRNRRRKIALSAISAALCIALVIVALGGNAPTVQAADLMEGITAQNVNGKMADAEFIAAQTAFALKIFQGAANTSSGENTMVSPLSVMLALSMTANGAGGQTKAEMEAVLGMPIDELNKYLLSYVNQITATEDVKLHVANSIWFRDHHIEVKQPFLQLNANYYGAAAYKSPFDSTTVSDINNWVKDNTDGMIDKIIDNIDPDTMMYLINAILFDAEWADPYLTEDEIFEGGIFTACDGTKQTVTYMNHTLYSYLEGANCTGFIKDYKGGQYKFVALLPEEGMSIAEFVASLTAEELAQILQNPISTPVHTALPQFSYDYSLEMKDLLSELGMPTAFDGVNADFSPMATADGNLCIGSVVHKTHITVDTRGTKTAAVTKGGMNCGSATMREKEVRLTRPFVYLIIDAETNIPIFMGNVLSIG